MQKIKVTKVETKPVAKGGTLVALFDEKGTRFSGFHASLQEVRGGDIINADIQVDGKYNNILSFEFVEKASRSGTIDKSAADIGSPGLSEKSRLDMLRMELLSQERRSVFHDIIELKSNGKYDNEIEAIYNNALEWAKGLFEVNQAPAKNRESVPSAEKPVKPAQDDKPKEHEVNGSVNPLLEKVCEAKSLRNYKTARQYLENALKVDNDRIDNEPETVWEEIKEKI